MDVPPVPYTPSVLTSEVYNDAEVVFTMLQNKERLISFLDCTTVLRAMGMNPTLDDMDRLRDRMADPVMLLEQWRREEELKREKERRKEEAREGRGAPRKSTAKSSGSKAGVSARKSVMEEVEKVPVKLTPAEEIKNIDWNIFIHCVEEMYRDATTEQREVLSALRAFNTGGPHRPTPVAAGQAASTDEIDILADDEEDESRRSWVATPGKMTVDEFIYIVTTNGDNVLMPGEVEQLRSILPSGDTPIEFAELAARLQGTYRPPTPEELARIAAAELEAARAREEANKEAADDPLLGL